MDRRFYPVFFSSLFRAALAICVLLLATCGGKQTAPPPSSSAGTGAISFAVEWEPPPAPSDGAKALSARPMAPSIDVCTDYGISRVTMQVLAPGGIDNILATQSFDCNIPDHKGIISGVPVGSNLTLRVIGTVQETGNDWNGFSAPFTLASGETKNVGKVTMSYTGNDKTPPWIPDFTPKDNSSHVRDNTAIRVVFSERMATNTVIDNEAIVVTANISTRIPGTIAYSPADNSATFHPSGRLTSGAKHTVTVSGAVTDTAGLNLGIPNAWSFNVHSKGSWMDPVLIETAAGNVSAYSLAIDGNGDATAVWGQSDGLRNNIWASRYSVSENRWGTPGQIETESFDAGGPQAAADMQGNAIAVWTQTDGTGYNVWANRFSAGTWGNATMIERINNPASSSEVQVGMDGTGNAIAVWSQDSGTARRNIWTTKYTASSGSWDSSQINLDNNGGFAWSPSLAMHRVGEAVAGWRQHDGTRYNIWARRYTKSPFGGYGWESSPTPIENGTGDAYPPVAAVDGSGNAFVVWPQSDGTRYHIWTNRYDSVSKAWSGAGLLENDTSYDAFNVLIGANTRGDAAVVWDLYSSPHTLWVARFVAADNAWKAPEEIASDGSPSSIAIDENGNIVVGVTKGVVKPEAVRNGTWVRRYSATSNTWAPLLRIENNPGSNTGPEVAMDGDGNALAVWVQNDAAHPELPSHTNLWMNRYE